MIGYAEAFGVSHDGTYGSVCTPTTAPTCTSTGTLVIDNDRRNRAAQPIGGMCRLAPAAISCSCFTPRPSIVSALQLFVRLPGEWTDRLFTSEL